jgi:hypothetical protein
MRSQTTGWRTSRLQAAGSPHREWRSKRRDSLWSVVECLWLREEWLSRVEYVWKKAQIGSVVKK